jgi:hypothetical protein
MRMAEVKWRRRRRRKRCRSRRRIERCMLNEG